MSGNNSELIWLEQLQKKAKEVHGQEDEAIKTIRGGFVNRAIVLMDVVGSTAFKIEHSEKPEIWILRVKQFSELLAEAVRNCNGQVVKYIGDEVMATFPNVNDAQNLVARISEIEDNLKSATKYETRLKVAADYGSVYELTFDGHGMPDPQGSVVDRCARLLKFGMPGEVIASTSFVEKTPVLDWKKVGPTNLKGLGQQVIFQLGRVSVSIEERVEIAKRELDALNEGHDELQTEITKVRELNLDLQKQIIKLGDKPNPGAIAVEENSDQWGLIENLIQELNDYITEAPGSPGTYARFIFLHASNKGGERYNPSEGKVFDELIEASLVERDDSGYFSLDLSHPRNKKVVKKLQEIEQQLNDYLATDKPNPKDLFKWSLKAPEFWKKYIRWSVV